MSTSWASSTDIRCYKRGNSDNMASNLDLNACPAEAAIAMHSFIGPEIVDPVNSQQVFFPPEDYSHHFAQYSQSELDRLWDFQQGYSPLELCTPLQEHFHGEEEMFSLPSFEQICGTIVDVDAIEEDVQILSSPTGFPLARNRTRRNHPETIVIVEDAEVDLAQAGAIVGELDIGLTLNSHSMIPPTNAINSKENSNLQDNHIPERTIANVNPEPEKVIRKEAAFECPVCMNPLVDAISTICGHIFCEPCIKASIKAQKKCPTCRNKLTLRKFHKVYLPASNFHD